MTDSITLTIDNKQIQVPNGISIMRACELAGIQIPHFCYHSRLSVAGNCRMCLVELEGVEKPVASCSYPAQEGQVVRTQSQIVKDSRKAVMEFLLANHPLDCPLCDQAGECDLQDFSIGCGSDRSEFNHEKRTVNNPDLGPYIETFMNRCIHCMRCTRFSEEIAGKNEITGLFRGGEKVITNVENGEVTSNLSGNMIDLCPVGALTSKLAKYKFRPWELTKYETIDVLDSILPSIYADVKDNRIMRIRARENEEINQEWISNKSRFSYPELYKNRIENPEINGKQVNWHEIFDEILVDLHKINPKKIAGLVGNNLALEDIYSFKEFMTKTLNSQTVEMAENFKLVGLDKSHLTFESSIVDIDSADTILFVGTDLEQDSPVLNSRIFQQTRKRQVEVFNIGAQLDNYSYKINQLAKTPKVLLEDLKELKKAFYKAKNAIVFVNVETILKRSDVKAIVSKLQELKAEFNLKLNFYCKDSGLINAVEILGNKNTISKKLKAEEIDILFVYGEQNFDLELLKKAKKIIYVGTHHNEISKIADILLPSVTYSEKNGLWNNVEGRPLEVKAVTLPFAESRVDWKIWRVLSEFVGGKLTFNNIEQLREQLKGK